jgi:hypothetical protein
VQVALAASTPRLGNLLFRVWTEVVVPKTARNGVENAKVSKHENPLLSMALHDNNKMINSSEDERT